MRAYLTILKDSFHEALASRVLWVLLILATIFLLAIAPVKMNERRSAYFRSEDLVDVTELARTIARQGKNDRPSPGKQVWKLLDGATQELFLSIKAGTGGWDPVLHEKLREGLNNVRGEPEFYSPPAWANYHLGDEATALIERGIGNLTDVEVARLNRLLLEAAFPKQITPALDKKLFIGWMFWEMDNPMPFDKSMALEWTLKAFVDYFLGVAGVFVAIIVTASIIPNTFESGAIDLLLSKPIFRAALFLTKVVGGCAFVLLTVSYVVVGVWLIVGLRFGYWNHRLLLCIPLMMFLFAIYYSISALAGVVWKNAIISVVMALVFWVACWTVWFGKNVFETEILPGSRIIDLTAAGDDLLAVTKQNEVVQWTAKNRRWKEIFRGRDNANVSFGTPIHRPVYDDKNDRLLALGQVYVYYGNPTAAPSLLFGERDDGWKRHQGPKPPEGSSQLFVRPDGKIIIAGSDQIYRFDGSIDRNKPHVEHETDPAKTTPADKEPALKETALKETAKKQPASTDNGHSFYIPIGPDDWDNGSSVAMDRGTGRLAVYNRGTLRLLRTGADGRYEVFRSRDVGLTSDGLLVFSGDTLLLGLSDGHIKVLSAATLKQRRQYQPQADRAITQLVISPDGRWVAALLKNNKLWVYDSRKHQPVALGIARQGDISAIAFHRGNQLDYAHWFNHVTRLDLAAGQITEQFAPRLETSERFYWYVIKPLYTIFPKPGELGDMVTYLVTSKKTGLIDTDQKLNIWQPFWSNLAFLGVMLAIGSWYVYRKDF